MPEPIRERGSGHVVSATVWISGEARGSTLPGTREPNTLN